MLTSPLPEELADHFFNRNFLEVDVAHVARLKHFASGLSHFRPRHLELDRHRRLFDYLTEPRKIPRLLFVKRQAEDFVNGEAIDNFIERSIEKDFAVIDDQHTTSQFLDVLHVMTREQRHNAMLSIINAQKLADPLLADDVQADRRFVQE